MLSVDNLYIPMEPKIRRAKLLYYSLKSENNL